LIDILNRNSGKFQVLCTAVFSFVFLLAFHSWFDAHPFPDYVTPIETMIKNGAALDEKVNFLLKNIVAMVNTGMGNDAAVRGLLYSLGFVVAMILSVVLSSLVDPKYKSFVLLTRETEKSKSKYEEKQRKSWRVFVGSVVFSLLTGIAANIIVLLLTK
jgi:hypothetical protein